jgi:aminoglycoside phosphotransferase (APT) family kinase protein
MLTAQTKLSLSSQAEFDESKFKELVSKIFEGKDIEELRYLSYAYTNKTMLVRFADGVKVVAKVSIKEDRFKKLALEVELVKRLKKETSLPVPDVLHSDQSRESFEYPFVIYSFLNGENLVDSIEHIKDKAKVGEELAKLTAGIHSVKLPSPKFSLTTEDEDEKWVDIIRQTCSDGIDALKHNHYERAGDIEKYVKENITLVSEPKEYTLIHRDLQPQNIHWNSKNSFIQGIFDFETAMSGDPVFEFNFLERQLFKVYPEIKKAFYPTYAKLSTLPDNLEGLVKFYEVTRDLHFYPRDIKYGELDRANGDIESLERLIFDDYNVG